MSPRRSLAEIFVLVLPPPARGFGQEQAQAHHGMSVDEVAKQLTNPSNDFIANMIRGKR